VDPDHMRRVRLQRPELASAGGIPEPQQAISIAGHDRAIAVTSAAAAGVVGSADDVPAA
jgi:hypothetical protein